MDRRRFVGTSAACLGLMGVPLRSRSEQGAMTYIYNAPESGGDVRYGYHVDVLKAALDATRATDGPYVLKPSNPMGEEQQLAELRSGSQALTVMIRGALLDFAKVLWYVPIPIDKGILGYRVLLIRGQDQSKFSEVRTLADLRAFSIGQGAGWKDVDILRHNGLKVVTGPTYEGLFEMLARGAFDCFSRGVEEVGDEYSRRSKAMAGLAIERTLLLHYPLSRYFWFARDAQGKSLAARVNTGLQSVIRSGTLDRLFDRHFRSRLASLRLPARRLISLENPAQLPDATIVAPYSVIDPRVDAARSAGRPAR
jgi:hypothetical protein